MAVIGRCPFLESPVGNLWLLEQFLSPTKTAKGIKWSSRCNFQVPASSSPEDQRVAPLPAMQTPWVFKHGGCYRLHGGAKRCHLWLTSVEGWCSQSYSSSCCNFFGCFLQKISCSDSSVFYDRMQRTLRCLTIWLNPAKGPLCFPSISTQPSIQPGIDDLLYYRWKKGEMCKTGGEGSRNNFLLMTSIIVITVSATRRVFDDPKQNEDLQQWSPDFLNPEILLQTTTRMTGNGICILN